MGGEGGEIKEESAWAYALHGKWYWSPLRPPIQLPTASPQLPPNFTWQRDGLPPSTWISTWISCPVSISASLQSTSSSALTSTIMLECTSMARWRGGGRGDFLRRGGVYGKVVGMVRERCGPTPSCWSGQYDIQQLRGVGGARGGDMWERCGKGVDETKVAGA